MRFTPGATMNSVGEEYRFESAGAGRRWVRLTVTRRPVAWLSARLLPGLDRLASRMRRGRRILSAAVTGLPVIELVTTGARTSRSRAVRVLGLPVERGLLVIAANFGEQSHPSWYHNLVAHPRVHVVVNGIRTDHVARSCTGRRQRPDSSAHCR